MTDSKGLLLVVDDEEMNRDMLSRRLAVEGYAAMTAESGADALRMIAENEFDAILLDAMMPLQSGYETLAEIRKTRSGLELPVLMVTARSQSEDVVNAFEIGANDYITKPINFPVALARIQCHVGSRKLSSQLRESEMRYSLSAQGANDGLWDWDLVSDRIHFSDRWKSMLGFGPDEIADSPEEWFSRIHADDAADVRRAVLAHRSGETEQFESEHRMLHRDQSYRWFLTRGMAVRDAAGAATRMAGSQTDITRGKAADPLTGLPNRVLFMDHLDATVQRARREAGGYYAVLFLDLDRFKVVNDSLGHQAGDELLVVAARRLESCMRSTDLIARTHERSTVSRFGGDEFVVLLQGLADPSNAALVTDRILAEFAKTLPLRGHVVSLAASVGIAVGRTGEESADDLLRDADTAMYQAKTDGRSRWRLFDQSMRTQAIERLELEADLKRGIERGEFVVHYQPIVELPSTRVRGFEALIRWNHPKRGLVSPAEFVPIAEEIGFITELGAWVLESSCRQLREWRLEHPDRSDLFVSVNVATKQFAEPDFVERVQACLDLAGLEGRSLKLEITESAIVTDTQSASATIERLRALGVRISLDDFGTGYSSLSYLQTFKIDTLKIDRSFIAKLGFSPESNEIVRTIVNLAHNLGMEVIAEGVESDFQHGELRSFDCEGGQGYLYSRPVPAASVEALLSDSAPDRVADESADLSAKTIPVACGSRSGDQIGEIPQLVR